MAKAKTKTPLAGHKKKLTAAVAMLLVSAIMVVSSTYAWFTLSTAPEVTGITTTVGANGNLEIALSPENGDAASITSKVGDSIAAGQAPKSANVSWGNLVDLNDPAYGLGQIKLMPGRLNITDGKLNVNSPLLTAVYGSDGRVSELAANTLTGIYNAEDGVFPRNDAAFGVRAVGSASAMTPRQLAYRNARSNVSSYTRTAQSMASQSLVANGSDLADIIVKHAAVSGEDDQKYDQKYLTTMSSIITALDGSLDKVNAAMVSSLIGYAASAAGSDEAFTAVQAMSPEETEIKAVIAALQGAGMETDSLPFAAAIAKYDSTRTAVENAQTALTALNGKESLTWEEIKGVLTHLVNPDVLEINGYGTDEFRENLGDIVSSVMQTGLTVSMPTGGGVYADLADLCGDYQATVTIAEITYSGITVNNVPATMTTATTLDLPYLPAALTALTGAGAPEAGDNADANITDYYGYALDLYFRTNAPSSNLMLQTEEAQRVYADSNNEATQGGGSTMTFATSEGFGVDAVKALMANIAVVFTDREGNVYAYAKLDMAEAEETKIESSTFVNVTAPIYLYEATAENNAALVWGEKKAEQSITALVQNQATAVTAWVYLDGDKVDNSMVANAEQSMTGTMNLQFSSDADLVPMVNTPLKEGNN